MGRVEDGEWREGGEGGREGGVGLGLEIVLGLTDINYRGWG